MHVSLILSALVLVGIIVLVLVNQAKAIVIVPPVVPSLPPSLGGLQIHDLEFEPQTSDVYKYPLWSTSLTYANHYSLTREELPYRKDIARTNVLREPYYNIFSSDVYNLTPDVLSTAYPIGTVMVVTPASDPQLTQFAIMQSTVVPMEVNGTLTSQFAAVAQSWTNVTGPWVPSFGFVNATTRDLSIRLDNNQSPMLTVPPSQAILMWPLAQGPYSPYGAYFVPNSQGYFPMCGHTSSGVSRTEYLTDMEVLIACAALEAEASNLDSYSGTWPRVLTA